MRLSFRFVRCVLTLVAAAAVQVTAPAAVGQGYPTKSIRLIIPASPGGGTDALGRALADALGTAFRQQVIVDNRPGANGVIGSEALTRSAPDGYTLMMVQNSHTVNPAITRRLPYDTFNDFTPIATLARSPLVLVSAAATGVKTAKDLIEMGRRDPRSLSFASGDASTRLAIEMFSAATGLSLTTASYKGTGPAMVDVSGGHVNFAVTTIAATLPHRSAGKIHYVGVLSADRAAFLAEVATLKEQGLSEVEATGWWGVLGPPQMPRALVQDLNTAIRSVVESAEIARKMTVLSVDPWMTRPEEFDQFIRREVAVTLRLAKKAGLEPE